MTVDDTDAPDDVRRQFSTDAAVAVLGTGALALDSIPTSTQTQTQTTGQGTRGEQAELVLFANDYYPDADFTVVDEMQQAAAAEVLIQHSGDADRDDGEIRTFDDPYNWEGYIIRYDIGSAGLVTFLFSEEVDFEPGDSTALSGDVSFRGPKRRFVEVDFDGA